MEIYQDIIRNGMITEKGVRECESRYINIKEQVLDKYERAFTVLDIGANHGYFGFRIAIDFPNSTVIMIEGGVEEAPFLRKLCSENDLPNVILLEKFLSLQDLKDLGDCETFDVVLALNVIHHFKEDMREVSRAMVELGDQLIIELPVPDENACNQERIKRELPVFHPDDKIFETATHTISGKMRPTYCIPNPKQYLTKAFWRRDPFEFDPPIIITTLEKKILYSDRKDTTTEFKPGINFATFCILNGTYPTKNQVIDILSNLNIEKDHGDVRPWNMIISGNNIELIDYQDPFGGRDYYDHDWANLELIKERFIDGSILKYIIACPERW